MSQRVEILIAWDKKEEDLVQDTILEHIAQEFGTDWEFTVGIDCIIIVMDTNVSNGFNDADFQTLFNGWEQLVNVPLWSQLRWVERTPASYCSSDKWSESLAI